MPFRLVCVLPVLTLVVAATAHAQSLNSGECISDLDALAPYMLANDAGSADYVAQRGRASFDAALATARTTAAAAPNDQACLKVLRNYLRSAFRRSHLSLRQIDPTVPNAVRASAGAPSFRLLSRQTALIIIPTFADQAGAAIEALIKEHAKDIAQRPNLLVDVRANGGGSDWTYKPLLALAEANIRRDVGAQIWATPANAAASRAACDVFAPLSQQCRDRMRQEAEAIDRAPAGTFIAQPGERPLEIVEPRDVVPHPRRIGVLVDKGCASTCEEFLIAMRQSFKVKLFGQSSTGSLDYSNLRPWTLPSGKRRLMYATTRSLRLPEFAVDLAGIPPDQVLPTPRGAEDRERELAQVQRVLESARQ
ncbi:S41 family peptidase [Ramlibacter sp. MMS24-I3-19]|uniref:S41 family peptidase n=1 Tax=Ramlibacter sp. MMS24-I3-19 TaxID=3416606 RepID=UPI003D0707E0